MEINNDDNSPTSGRAAADPGATQRERRDRVAQRIRTLSRWLDGAFRIPGTRIRLGWDALIGLLPVVGDAAGVALSSYLVHLAARAGAPRRMRVQMGANILLDFLLGLVPVVGDLIDITSRANLRNLKMLEGWLEEQDRQDQRPAPQQPDWPRMLFLLVLGFALVAVFTLTGGAERLVQAFG